MTRTGLALALWTLGTAAAGAAPCSPSPAALCLSGGRFEVKATWKDFQGKTGQGQAVAITADTGYFWFFNDTNIELIVKVLDARALNGKFWVFFGALSNVEYDLTVTDSSTGASKTYHDPSGQFASVGDTGAFEAAARTARVSHEVVVTDGTAAPPDSIAALQKFIERARLARHHRVRSLSGSRECSGTGFLQIRVAGLLAGLRGKHRPRDSSPAHERHRLLLVLFSE